MGFRYRFNSLKTHLGTNGEESYLTTIENYRNLEWWGAWNLGKKFRVMAAVPYSFNERINQGNSTQKQGLGDITLSGYFQLWKHESTWQHRYLGYNLWIGGGIKLPTGSYNPDEKAGSTQNTNLFQLGTGSVDYLISTMYDVRLQDVGININGSWKWNNVNQHHYRYGNKLSLAGQVYYKVKPNPNWSIAPNIGLVYETAKQDEQQGFKVDISGGKVLLASIGSEFLYKKIAIGASLQSPLSQNLANGFVHSNNRLMVHLAYQF